MSKNKKNLYHLVQDDCLKGMKTIPDKSVDLILTDPPYNLGLFMEKRATNLGALRSNHFVASGWDHIEQEEWEQNIHLFLEESKRVLKKNGAMIIFMAIIKVETIIRLAQVHGLYYKTTGIWHKKNPIKKRVWKYSDLRTQANLLKLSSDYSVNVILQIEKLNLGK
jgi:DNA modification methylase